MKDAISVVIPTTASAQRAPLLWRAVRSLQGTSDGEVLPIVVVNGDRYDPSILEALKRRRDIRCLYLEVGDHVEARRVGRCAVDTEFFGLLDDDDEYLSGTLQVRLEPLRRDSSLDVVITNGYRHHAGQDALQFPQLAAF